MIKKKKTAADEFHLDQQNLKVQTETQNQTHRKGNVENDSQDAAKSEAERNRPGNGSVWGPNEQNLVRNDSIEKTDQIFSDSCLTWIVL